MLTLEGDVICQWHPLILHTRCNYISNMITEYGIEAKSNSEIISESGGRFKDGKPKSAGQKKIQTNGQNIHAWKL
jgi:hypothetical protein